MLTNLGSQMILLTYSVIVNQAQALLLGLKFEVDNNNKKYYYCSVDFIICLVIKLILSVQMKNAKNQNETQCNN